MNLHYYAIIKAPILYAFLVLHFSSRIPVQQRHTDNLKLGLFSPPFTAYSLSKRKVSVSY